MEKCAPANLRYHRFYFLGEKNTFRKSWLENPKINLKAKFLGKATRYINSLTCKFSRAKNKSVFLKKTTLWQWASTKDKANQKLLRRIERFCERPQNTYKCTANFAPEAILLKIPISHFCLDSINAEIASIGIFYSLYSRALERIVELRNFIFPS